MKSREQRHPARPQCITLRKVHANCACTQCSPAAQRGPREGVGPRQRPARLPGAHAGDSRAAASRSPSAASRHARRASAAAPWQHLQSGASWACLRWKSTQPSAQSASGPGCCRSVACCVWGSSPNLVGARQGASRSRYACTSLLQYSSRGRGGAGGRSVGRHSRGRGQGGAHQGWRGVPSWEGAGKGQVAKEQQ